MSRRSSDEATRSPAGYGLVQPFRRQGGKDFVAAHGTPLVKACIGQILGTRKGELRWRPSFGTDIEPYRHRNLNVAEAGALASDIKQAILEWESRVGSVHVTSDMSNSTTGKVSASNNVLRVSVAWALHHDLGSAGNADIPPYSVALK